MNGSILLQVAIGALFGAVAVNSARSAMRSGRRIEIEAAAMFSAIAVIIIGATIAGATGNPAARAVALLIAVLLPYLQLRVVSELGEIHPLIRYGTFVLCAIVLVAASLAIAAPLDPTASAILTAAAFVYVISVELYVAIKFFARGRGSVGVAGGRYHCAGLGALFIGLSMLGFAITAAGQPVLDGLARLLLFLGPLCYLLGFAPPRILRRGWREPGLRLFTDRLLAISPSLPEIDILREVERAVAEAVGPGLTVTAAVYNDLTKRLEYSDGRVDEESSPARRAFDTQKGVVWLTNGRTEVAIPLAIRGRALGLLRASANRTPLFLTDRTEFLELLGREAAHVLDSAHAYAALRRVNGELALKLKELEDTNAELDEATRAKSQFLANMSHELRTPLNAILGFTDLLTEQLSDTVHDDQRRYLRNVGQAGQHLLGLINDLLDLAKVEAGRIELRPEVIRLESLMEPTIAATRSLAAAKSIQFVTNDLPDTSVRVDPARVRQVLYNLLSNAVKFTPEGGRVTLRADVHAGALVIEVHDTGVGIPLEHRDRLFMAFERFHEGVVDAPGAGLGLAVTKRLVELHHGTIDVESTIGVGTTFRVRLFDVAVSSINGHRILIVDDVASDADLISTIAAEMGLRSEIVGTAAAAVEAVERDAPAAIVLDYRLPDGRGEAVLRHVKANRSTAKIPVIVVTVEDDDGRSRPLGADDHLTKPIDRRRLEAWLQIITPERNEVVAP